LIFQAGTVVAFFNGIRIDLEQSLKNPGTNLIKLFVAKFICPCSKAWARFLTHIFVFMLPFEMRTVLYGIRLFNDTGHKHGSNIYMKRKEGGREQDSGEVFMLPFEMRTVLYGIRLFNDTGHKHGSNIYMKRKEGGREQDSGET
jgi:hypothetical protein